MDFWVKLKELIFGKPKDVFGKEGQKNILLIAFFAWVGLGADGLSSACYGPQLGYLALGSYQHLALYLALLTAATVFLIAISYNQVIELFPDGGGGYKVAKVLLGPIAGVISGSALLIDYALTISISIASAVEALLSLISVQYQQHKVLIIVVVIFFLMVLNLRGIKESIRILIPIFLGFFITHLAIIVYGVVEHGFAVPKLIDSTIHQTHTAVSMFGYIAVIGILLRAYSLGSGTYTGLEAVSNNVNILAEPRVRTGKITMYYMAVSLSIIAGGIILLYLLWDAHLVYGKTLNAVVFQHILGSSNLGHISLMVLLFLEAGILFVGANTGFLGGPAVLGNMALDDWVPRRFTTISSRLVRQNGILFFGVLAVVMVILTQGHVHSLVIFYSINVFITFSVSLLGLSVYWWRNRKEQAGWLKRFILSSLGFSVCMVILLLTVVSRFGHGSGAAVLLTIVVVATCYFLKSYYDKYERLKRELNESLKIPLKSKMPAITEKIDTSLPTAVFFAKGSGPAMHTILWVERMFPKHFKNYVFVSYGVVDVGSYGSDRAVNTLKKNTDADLDYLVRFASDHGISAKSVSDYGIDPVEGIAKIVEGLNEEFSNPVYFAARYVYPKENIVSRFIHSDFSLAIQRRLQSLGTRMLIIPLKL